MAAELPFFSTQNHTACLYSNLNVDANSVLHQPPLLVHFPALLRCQQRAGSALCCPAAALSPSWALHGCSLLTLAPHRLFREGSSCIAVGSSALRTECKCNRDFLLRVFFFFFFKTAQLLSFHTAFHARSASKHSCSLSSILTPLSSNKKTSSLDKKEMVLPAGAKQLWAGARPPARPGPGPLPQRDGGRRRASLLRREALTRALPGGARQGETRRRSSAGRGAAPTRGPGLPPAPRRQSGGAAPCPPRLHPLAGGASSATASRGNGRPLLRNPRSRSAATRTPPPF